MADTPAQQDKRPLSPHLAIYQPQLTWLMSITHRTTGAALVLGTLLLVWWLLAAASGPAAFAAVQWFLGSWLGILLLLGWTWAFMYHLANGIRHLMWDTVTGLDLPVVYLSGRIALVASVVLTLLVWLVALLVM